MKREIKFRGKRVDNGEWVFGSAMLWNGIAQIIKHHHKINSIWKTESFMVIPETVGQFIGIEVKNSMELFEGDIFHMGDKNIKYEVVWYDCGFKGKQLGSNANYVGLDFWKKEITVIGDIYDNLI